MKIKRELHYDDGEYGVTTPNGSAEVTIYDCDVSCGIKEIQNVGGFIRELNVMNFNSEQIADEIKIMANKIKKCDDESSAFIMLSLADPGNLYKNVCTHLKERGAKITGWRKNPNSGNKINVVIM